MCVETSELVCRAFGVVGASGVGGRSCELLLDLFGCCGVAAGIAADCRCCNWCMCKSIDCVFFKISKIYLELCYYIGSNHFYLCSSNSK